MPNAEDGGERGKKTNKKLGTGKGEKKARQEDFFFFLSPLNPSDGRGLSFRRKEKGSAFNEGASAIVQY